MERIQRYERWDGSSILSGGTKVLKLFAGTCKCRQVGCEVYWVALQKVVPEEKFADLVFGERGRQVGFESHRIYSKFNLWRL